MITCITSRHHLIVNLAADSIKVLSSKRFGFFVYNATAAWTEPADLKRTIFSSDIK